MTFAKRVALINVMAPKAAALHSERLIVRRLTEKLMASSVSTTGVSVLVFVRVVRLPFRHHTEPRGTNDSDYLLYVSASSNADVTAWTMSRATSSG